MESNEKKSSVNELNGNEMEQVFGGQYILEQTAMGTAFRENWPRPQCPNGYSTVCESCKSPWCSHLEFKDGSDTCDLGIPGTIYKD